MGCYFSPLLPLLILGRLCPPCGRCWAESCGARTRGGSPCHKFLVLQRMQGKNNLMGNSLSMDCCSQCCFNEQVSFFSYFAWGIRSFIIFISQLPSSVPPVQAVLAFSSCWWFFSLRTVAFCPWHALSIIRGTPNTSALSLQPRKL